MTEDKDDLEWVHSAHIRLLRGQLDAATKELESFHDGTHDDLAKECYHVTCLEKIEELEACLAFERVEVAEWKTAVNSWKAVAAQMERELGAVKEAWYTAWRKTAGGFDSPEMCDKEYQIWEQARQGKVGSK